VFTNLVDFRTGQQPVGSVRAPQQGTPQYGKYLVGDVRLSAQLAAHGRSGHVKVLAQLLCCCRHISCQRRNCAMSLTTITGIALMLSTLIYHGGLSFLFVRAQFLEVLKLPRKEQLLIIAKHTGEYRWGCRIILTGWVVAALGYVLLAVLLHDAGELMISTLAAVLFLLGIASALVFLTLYMSPTILAAEEMARTSHMPAYYETLQVAAESALGVYQLLALLATAGFGWALLQTGILPSWVGWVTLGWGLVWAVVFVKTSEAIPLLPMVVQIVIGLTLFSK
jgi:hypothetical protein